MTDLMVVFDYWRTHPGFVGFLLLFAFALLPRVSLLFTVATSFSVGGWFFWWILPSFSVAYYATEIYGGTNIILVSVAWVWVSLKFVYFLIYMFSD